MDKVGVYKARAVKRADGTWAQYGERETSLELIIEVELQIDGGKLRRSIPLYITDKSYDFTVERLRACGWKGEDVANLDGLGDNEIDVEVTVETYDGKTNNKYNILTGGGRFTVKNPVDPKMFAAKMSAIRGNMAPPAASGSPPPKPPF